MKDKSKQRLNAFKSNHKRGSQNTPAAETGIPNTDVLGMQKVNQAKLQSDITAPQSKKK